MRNARLFPDLTLDQPSHPIHSTSTLTIHIPTRGSPTPALRLFDAAILGKGVYMTSKIQRLVYTNTHTTSVHLAYVMVGPVGSRPCDSQNNISSGGFKPRVPGSFDIRKVYVIMVRTCDRLDLVNFSACPGLPRKYAPVCPGLPRKYGPVAPVAPVVPKTCPGCPENS